MDPFVPVTPRSLLAHVDLRKRECPTGVDMARMKVEFLHQYHAVHPRSVKDKLIAHLPRYAATLARFPKLANLRNRIGGLAYLGEKFLGFAARRSLPEWRGDYFRGQAEIANNGNGNEVVLLPDTFNTYFEPENLRAAVKLLIAGGYKVTVAELADEARPLCCGRTYLASGMIDEARSEAERTMSVLEPYVRVGIPIVGLEPSCLFSLRDEFASLLPQMDSAALAASALSFEEFIVRENRAGRFDPPFKALPYKRALVHGHCHQKAFGQMPVVIEALALIPELEVEVIQSGCCGMAGAFGYDARHMEESLAMAEIALLPAVREAGDDTVIVADGTSCRHQIHDGTAREARHLVRVLAESGGFFPPADQHASE